MHHCQSFCSRSDRYARPWTGWTLYSLLLSMSLALGAGQARAEGWKKHVVHEGHQTLTAVAADFTGDGKTDVISNSDGKTRLFVGPAWREVILSEAQGHNFIHSEVMDPDADGDPDFVGTNYSPGLIVWYERPKRPLSEPWPVHKIDDQVNGIHGLITGDVNRDGRLDLLANSAQPKDPYPNSLVWYHVPADSRAAWKRHVFAQGDAPGLSHYLGFGDINGDGRPDAASAAKGGPSAVPGTGNWFAWWQAPTDSTQVWTKHLVADDQAGATNIHPADVNGDGRVDLVASRGHGQGVIWFEAPTWKLREIHATIREPHCLVVADFDQDGDADAATCAYGDRVAAWYENDGAGQFTVHVVGRNQAAYDIRAVDMDGDSDLDLLVAGQQSANVVWYANPVR